MAVPKMWYEKIMGYDPWRNAQDCRFDVNVARRVCGFFPKYLTHSAGEFANKPFMLERWQKLVVGHAFGWKRADGTRRFRKVFLYIPRKNGKTQLAAGILIIMLVGDSEPGAEVYCCASDTDQAHIVFRESTNMVRCNPELKAEIEIRDGYKTMKFEKLFSFCRVLSSDAKGKHGYKPSAYIIDEVHAQKNSELMEVLETGTASRRQPLGLYLTTADYAGPSACNDMLEYARKVRDGSIDDPEFLPIIYEPGVNDDWKLEKTWKKVNPNYGISIKPDYFHSQFKKALENPSFENTFKRLHLNIQTEQEHRWISVEDWKACPNDIDISELEGERAFGALDLGSTNDLTAFVLYFPDHEACLAWFWSPDESVEKKIEYQIWKKQGFLETTPGRVTDYNVILQRICGLNTVYDIEQIAYDPWNAAQVAFRLGEKGFDTVEFRQGFISMNEPSKEFEKMIMEHRLRHFNNPMLLWMAANAQVKEDAGGNIKPVKPSKDSPQKIDGIICLVMAKGLEINANLTEKPKESVYETRGLIVL